MNEYMPLGGKILTRPFKIMMLIAGIAVVLIIKRFIFGLGSVTNLNDGYPWGLWIVYDVVVGTAIACGGYAMALLVYVFNRFQYHPLIRSALLASMFGYTLAGISVCLDLGRWWQLHNIFLPGYMNTNSIMLEVAICIALYVMVMWIEFSPTFFEYKHQEKTLKRINKYMFVFLGLGILLPTMHQSSLGTLMVIAGDKLSPLWQTSFLPLLFLITAITMGYAMVIFESIYSSIGFHRPFENTMLARISAFIPKLIGLFLVFRIGDLLWRDQIGTIFSSGSKSVTFLVENILFIVPVIILSKGARRVRTHHLFLSAVTIILAGALYRFNTFLIGFSPKGGYQYFPAVSEIMITLGIISIEIMAYIFFIKKFPILPRFKHA
jgi:Ni/Fe-hydrogenase subunit HybB-like protein